jgi:hypothetical protein
MNNFTSNGGLLSCDCIGFGPEEYWIKRATPGQYDIKLKLFSNTNKSQPVVASVWVWVKFGGEDETLFRRTVVLRDEKEICQVASVLI